MTQHSIGPPEADEYAPFYAGYIARVAGADIRRLLTEQVRSLHAACSSLTEAGALHRYAEGKWSIKEVIGHMTDAERIFAYRVLCIARGDRTALPGFDENAYVAAADFDRRPIAALIEDLADVRASTLRLLDSIEPELWQRRGNANGADMSVRAAAHIIAGHTQHHLTLLGERYGVDLAAPGAAGEAG